MPFEFLLGAGEAKRQSSGKGSLGKRSPGEALRGEACVVRLVCLRRASGRVRKSPGPAPMGLPNPPGCDGEKVLPHRLVKRKDVRSLERAASQLQRIPRCPFRPQRTYRKPIQGPSLFAG